MISILISRLFFEFCFIQISKDLSFRSVQKIRGILRLASSARWKQDCYLLPPYFALGQVRKFVQGNNSFSCMLSPSLSTVIQFLNPAFNIQLFGIAVSQPVWSVVYTKQPVRSSTQMWRPCNNEGYHTRCRSLSGSFKN